MPQASTFVSTWPGRASGREVVDPKLPVSHDRGAHGRDRSSLCVAHAVEPVSAEVGDRLGDDGPRRVGVDACQHVAVRRRHLDAGVRWSMTVMPRVSSPLVSTATCDERSR